ncbi:MAG: hypothetical protein A2Z20_09330 [Bdellovibrionales bacterium RBG_16_40_8]|nr:MAG: hypothetical protein A2Z20_09330 [Bdellovibrionales bacterium RBG_16_40_8]
MRNLITLALLISAQIGFNNVAKADSSWAEIINSNLYVMFPKIYMPNNGVGYDYLPITALCKNGDMLRTVEPVSVCVRARGFKCKEYALQTLITPILHPEERCTSWHRGRCVDRYTEIVPYPLHYKISVYNRRHLPRDVMFKKIYSIPACSKI